MEKQYTIRRAERNDIPSVMKLLVQVNMVHHALRPDLFNGPAAKYTENELEQIFQNDLSPVFVCVDNETGRVIGHCFCKIKQYLNHNILTDVKTLYIDDLCVDESFREHHAGKALYQQVFSYAKDQGCHNITLNVWEGNGSALAFYARQGFKPQKYEMEVIL